MGFLDHLSDVCECSQGDTRKFKKLKKRPLLTVEIRVKMDYEGCVRRVRKSVEGIKGVTHVDVKPKKHRLTVMGHVDLDKVLHRVRHRTRKKADFWPYFPYDGVEHPYAIGVYDKKAPIGYVQNVVGDLQASSLARASSIEVK